MINNINNINNAVIVALPGVYVTVIANPLPFRAAS